jgi:hypothetical protein
MFGRFGIAALALIAAAGLSVGTAFSVPQLRPPGEAKAVYHWAQNLTIAPPETGKQRAETTLATDKDGRVWLSYLDADYFHTSYPLPPIMSQVLQTQDLSGLWLAWPRRLTVVRSQDQGKTFGDPTVLSPMGGNASFTTDSDGNLYASWVQYSYDDHKHLDNKIVAARLDGQSPVRISTELQCPVWIWPVEHDQSNLTVSHDGTFHIIGLDINMSGRPSDQQIQRLLYARSTDGLKSCTDLIRLRDVGQLPVLVSTHDALLIVGALGFYASADSGETFGPRQPHPFANKVVRAAASRSSSVAYVVGDATSGGLWLNATADGGKTWQKARVDDARRATAWRFPAITVGTDDRIHVVWMDDREGYGAVYHAYSDDGGRHFSKNERVSDRPFPFPTDSPPPPPANQKGTWVGDY